MKIQKKFGGGGGFGWGGGRFWSGGGCEQRSEAFVKIKKKKSFLGGRGKGGPVGGGVRVDVNEEVSFCENSKKIFFIFLGGGWAGEGVSDQGWGGGGGSKV